MTKYNPNNYVVKIHTPEGIKLGYFNKTGVITDSNDKILCSLKDFLLKGGYFTEVIVDVPSIHEYNIGSEFVHGDSKYFVLEVEETVDEDDIKVYSYIVGR